LLNGQAYHRLLLMPYIAFANNKHIQRPFKKKFHIKFRQK
jgi:hypothetical protein